MIKFTKDHINLLSLANEKVQDLQRQQMKIYEDLLQNLPDLSKESKTKNRIWDYVFNDVNCSLTLDENGLKINQHFTKTI